jgi:hypothetical protein
LLAEKIQADRSAPQEALERRTAHGPGAGRRRRKPAMRGRPDPVGVAAEFLRKELAKGPVLVSELEAAARAAGLLGSGQRISDAKPFKRAKKSLGIRSVRNGFGSAGEWLWLLERRPAPLVAEPRSEVAPRIPSSWIEGVGRLSQRRPPPDRSRPRARPSACEARPIYSNTVKTSLNF